MKYNFQIKSLILAVFFLLISSFIFFFAYKQIKNNSALALKAEEKWQAEAVRREDIKSLDQSVKMIEPERAQLEEHFAQSSDVVPFLNTIENLALKTSAKAKVSLVDIAEDKTGLLVEMKAKGSFESVYKFLMLLENSLYELEFNSVDIHTVTVDEKASTFQWEATFKIKLLSFVL